MNRVRFSTRVGRPSGRWTRWLFFLPLFYLGCTTRAKIVRNGLAQDTLAHVYASELLDRFRSIESSTALLKRLQVNPMARSRGEYSYCSPVNFFDRENNKFDNADPMATLPNSTLDTGPGAMRAFRYYKVQVINMDNMSQNTKVCSKKFGQPLELNPNERFMISVGVSWVPEGHPISDAKEVVITTVLPDR